MQLYSRWLFHLKSSCQGKLRLNFSNLKFEFFQMTSDGEITKIKVVDLQKLCNFVVDNFLIWIRLESQTINLNSIEDNMRRKKIHYRYKWVWGAVVRGVSHEGEVDWWGLPRIKKSFLLFFEPDFQFLKIICSSGSLEDACEVLDFQWPLPLAVLTDACRNNFKTASSELYYTNECFICIKRMLQEFLSGYCKSRSRCCI